MEGVSASPDDLDAYGEAFGITPVSRRDNFRSGSYGS
jgi:hypothetical protein